MAAQTGLCAHCLDLRQVDLGAVFSSHAGVAHTRWATHGPPTATNAHPHGGGLLPAHACCRQLSSWCLRPSTQQLATSAARLLLLFATQRQQTPPVQRQVAVTLTAACLAPAGAVSGKDHQFVVVHNGIITNFRPLKNFLVRVVPPTVAAAAALGVGVAQCDGLTAAALSLFAKPTQR